MIQGPYIKPFNLAFRNIFSWKSADEKTVSLNYVHFRNRLVIGLALVSVLLISILAWDVYSSYKKIQAESRLKTQIVVSSIESQVSYAINFAELSLNSFVNAFSVLSDSDFKNPDVIKKILSVPGADFGSEFWVLFINAKGIGVAASNSYPVKGVSYADRDYFAIHSEGHYGDRVFVGEPDFGRVSNRPIFFLSRRVVNAQGVFIGVLAAPIDASRFAALFESSRFSKETSIALVHRDGKIIARVPGFTSSFATNVLKGELFRHLSKSDTETFVSTSIVDNQTRVFSYRVLKNLPLIVNVGISADVWNDELKKDIETASAGFLFIFIIMTGSGYAALRSFALLEYNNARHQQLTQEIRVADERRLANEKLMRAVTNHIPAMVSYIDLEQRFVFNNGAYEKWFGRPIDRITGFTLMEVYGPDIYKVHRRHFDIAKAGRTSEFEFYEIRDGLQFHFAAIYVPQFDDNAQVVGVCSMINDITRSKQIEQELIRLARYDTLTGLPNRNQLNERLPEVIARCARMGLTAAVLYLDIDKFKQINDSMGHYAGDLVLQEFARRLLTAVRTTDMVVRLAGDEFVIVLEALENVDVSVVTEKILRSMDAPFVIEGSQRKVKASIGAVTFSDGQHDVSVILKKADEALYMAKAAGRNTAIILDLSSA